MGPFDLLFEGCPVLHRDLKTEDLLERPLPIPDRRHVAIPYRLPDQVGDSGGLLPGKALQLLILLGLEKDPCLPSCCHEVPPPGNRFGVVLPQNFIRCRHERQKGKLLPCYLLRIAQGWGGCSQGRDAPWGVSGSGRMARTGQEDPRHPLVSGGRRHLGDAPRGVSTKAVTRAIVDPNPFLDTTPTTGQNTPA